MTVRRRIAFAAAGVTAGVLIMLAMVPLLFRDRLEARVKAQIESGLDARVDWGRVGASLFRDFPNLTLRLDDLVVTGVDRFAGDALAVVPSFRMVLGLATPVYRLGQGIVARVNPQGIAPAVAADDDVERVVRRMARLLARR